MFMTARLVILASVLAFAGCGSSSNSPEGTGGSAAGSGGTGTGGSGGMTGGAGGGGGTSATAFLDDCFAGLRKLADTSQTSDRSSSDGASRVRLAIESPPGSVGTSGTVPWKAVRVGVVTPQKRVCIKDEAALAAAYKGSLHNCMDVLEVTSDGVSFQITPPDVSPTRPVAMLTVAGSPAVTLPTMTCKNTTGGACGSGGPCQ